MKIAVRMNIAATLNTSAVVNLTLTSLKTEQCRRSKLYICSGKLYIDIVHLSWYHNSAFSRNGG